MPGACRKSRSGLSKKNFKKFFIKFFKIFFQQIFQILFCWCAEGAESFAECSRRQFKAFEKKKFFEKKIFFEKKNFIIRLFFPESCSVGVLRVPKAFQSVRGGNSRLLKKRVF